MINYCAVCICTVYTWWGWRKMVDDDEAQEQRPPSLG
jgi:hypothetical protein